MKRKNPRCGSAERPVSRKKSDSGCAGRPASLVAYIDAPRSCWIRSESRVEKAVQNAIGVGATIINVTIERAADADLLFRTISGVLRSFWGAQLSSENVGTVMSFYTSAHWELLDRIEIDPEYMSPALMLTFRERHQPGLQMCVLTLSLRQVKFPRAVRTRLLDAYIEDTVASNSNGVIIGGVFNVGDNSAQVLWLENKVTKLDFDIQVTTNDSLSVLPWCKTGSMKCVKLDHLGPYTLVIEHEPNGAEQPAALTTTEESRRSDSSERSSAEQHAASSSSSASCGSKRAERSSSEQPAAPTGAKKRCISHEPREPSSFVKPATPLYDKFLDDLGDGEQCSALVKLIEEHCFHSKLRYVCASGYRAPGTLSFSYKMETLFQICEQRRQAIADASGLTDEEMPQHRATKEEMKKMYNDWRHDVNAWMNKKNQRRYSDHVRAHRHSAAQKMGKSCFSTYLFQISGCKFLLGKLIELPIISAASHHTPRVLRDLLDSLEEHKKTEEYQREKERSNNESRDQIRLSNAIWWARSDLFKAKPLSTKVLQGKIAWSKLGTKDQQLVEDYQTKRLKKKLVALEARKANKFPAYRGTHVEAWTSGEY